jgi:hypothetical protein
MTTKIPLHQWRLKAFRPPISQYQANLLVKQGRISPPPVRLGLKWWVDENATVLDAVEVVDPVVGKIAKEVMG